MENLTADEINLHLENINEKLNKKHYYEENCVCTNCTMIDLLRETNDLLTENNQKLEDIKESSANTDAATADMFYILKNK